MNRKELTKTFMMISNWKKPICFHGLYKNISALQGLSSVTWPHLVLGSEWVNPLMDVRCFWPLCKSNAKAAHPELIPLFYSKGRPLNLPHSTCRSYVFSGSVGNVEKEYCALSPSSLCFYVFVIWDLCFKCYVVDYYLRKESASHLLCLSTVAISRKLLLI